jgi:hypothetical protein
MGLIRHPPQDDIRFESRAKLVPVAQVKSLVKSAFVKQLIAVFSHCWPNPAISGETPPFGLTF